MLAQWDMLQADPARPTPKLAVPETAPVTETAPYVPPAIKVDPATRARIVEALLPKPQPVVAEEPFDEVELDNDLLELIASERWQTLSASR